MIKSELLHTLFAQAGVTTTGRDTMTNAACRERITDRCLIGFSGIVFSYLSVGHAETGS